MSNWWTHLSWSHAMLVLLLALFAICLLGIILGRLIRFGMGSEPPRPQGSWDVVDYSGAFQKQREWLGDNHLLATPVNRIGSAQ